MYKNVYMFNSKISTSNTFCFSNQILNEIIKVSNSSTKQPIVLRCKNMTIFRHYIGSVFLVYNGHLWSTVVVKEPMVGRKFGEFIFTKKIAKFSKKGERRRNLILFIIVIKKNIYGTKN